MEARQESVMDLVLKTQIHRDSLRSVTLYITRLRRRNNVVIHAVCNSRKPAVVGTDCLSVCLTARDRWYGRLMGRYVQSYVVDIKQDDAGLVVGTGNRFRRIAAAADCKGRMDSRSDERSISHVSCCWFNPASGRRKNTRATAPQRVSVITSVLLLQPLGPHIQIHIHTPKNTNHTK